MTILTVAFDDQRSTEHELVGGKGANLGLLTHAGFEVPAGFNISTNAYADFVAASRLTDQIAPLLGEIDYTGIDSVEAATARIRQCIVDAPVPETVAARIREDYRRLGPDTRVAVRSSGTAEDLAGTSFAGMHDSYLHVQGEDAVLDAVRRCWASLWTARAVTYRNSKGFDHLTVGIAVVVQTMVDADVSGVMFTGNPRNDATNETVINANWGLGESIVQGIVNPDEFVVASASMRILERTLGSKEVQIVRGPDGGEDVVTIDAPDADRRRWSLTDEQVAELAHLGRQVAEYYNGFPQDIEWAMRDSKPYLLQSRPITGVDFSWDAEIDDSFQEATEDHEAVWTRVFADEMWTGPVTPLMYEFRVTALDVPFWDSLNWLNRQDLRKHRMWKYHKGVPYWNCNFEKGWNEQTLPHCRDLSKVPESWRQDLQEAKFSLIDYVKQLYRVKACQPAFGVFGWFHVMEDYFANRIAEAEGPPADVVRRYSDQELKRHVRRQMAFEDIYNIPLVAGFPLYSRDAVATLARIISEWYTGDNEHAYPHLVSGTPVRAATIREHIHLFQLSRTIKNSDRLSSDFLTYPGGEFFERLADSEEGREYALEIAAFYQRSGHRGHPERDIYYQRYHDNPEILYRSLQTHLKSDEDPEETERQTNARREAAFDDVVQNLRRQSMGWLKVEAFKFVHEYVMKFFVVRANEREYIDRNTYSIRLGLIEVGRRLEERGMLDTDRDFWMLTTTELFEFFDGNANVELTKAKIAARMRNFDRIERKEVSMPKFLHRGRALEEGEVSQTRIDDEGRLVIRGSSTSSGTVTGTARVVKELQFVNRVNPNEILVANATDPGWTPVFAVISGVIVETGGLLSHSACMAREYGFPAAQVENAVRLIPDGATITVNGDTGEVIVHGENGANDPLSELVAPDAVPAAS